jgi:hypothetical protein
MDKRFLGILGILVIIFGGIFVASQHSSSNSSGGSSGNGQPTNHVQGQNAKNVTFVEYGDYECPICGAYYQPLKSALTPDVLQNIHFQFRNLPLVSIHQNAFAIANTEFSDPSTGAPSPDKIQKVINGEIAKKASQSKQ